MKNKKIIISAVTLSIIASSTFFVAQLYETKKVEAQDASSIVQPEELEIITEIDEKTKKELEKVAVDAVEFSQNGYYIEKKDGNNIDSDDLEKAKEKLKKDTDKMFSQNSSFAKNKIEEYSRIMESQVDSEEVYLGGKVEKYKLEITELDREFAKGKITETSFIKIIPDKNSNSKNEKKIENETIHTITFVKENGAWKVDEFKIDFMRV